MRDDLPRHLLPLSATRPKGEAPVTSSTSTAAQNFAPAANGTGHATGHDGAERRTDSTNELSHAAAAVDEQECPTML